jgi:tetratricopeptide (TPR) repeat protein
VAPRFLLLSVLLLGPVLLSAARAQQPPTDRFADLGIAFVAANASGDQEQAERVLQRIRELRMERNVRSLTSVALALIDVGLTHLASGERAAARNAIQAAIEIDPWLPDAYFARARLQLRRGPLGIVGAIGSFVSGFRAGLSTSRGQAGLMALAGYAGLLSLLAFLTVLAVTFILRYAALLRHDLEESLGTEERRGWATTLSIILLLLPLIAFQGYAWLPLWCVALLFIDLRSVEKVLALSAIAALALLVPLLRVVDLRLRTEMNPLYQAGVRAIEGEGNARDVDVLKKARASAPEDRDLGYLLAAQYKKTDRYREARAVLSDMLGMGKDSGSRINDAIALNNLANLDFAENEWTAAIERYRQARDYADVLEVKGTIIYNLSLAYLQTFQYQYQQQARNEADSIASDLVASHERTWHVTKAGTTVYGVVDLGPTRGELLAKYVGAVRGVVPTNVTGTAKSWLPTASVAGAVVNRITAFLIVLGLVAFIRTKWRGPRAFTLRCQKCGAVFCRKCHLGAAIGGLCSQCHHLFNIRDGVSGPARNQKLLEVQDEEIRRERVFRILSLISPGAGHLYGRRVLRGAGVVLLWYVIIFASLLAVGVIPITDAPAWLAGPMPLIAAIVPLIAIYVIVNRLKPELEAVLPARLMTIRGRRR